MCQNKFKSPKVYVYSKYTQLLRLTKKWPWEISEDFIIKPIVGSHGRGFVRFLYSREKNSYFSSREKRWIPYSMMEDYILFEIDLSHQDILIQEKIENHDILDQYSNDAIAIIRILSIIDMAGVPTLYRPIIQFPQHQEVVSYLHKGAKVFTIDLETGSLLNCINYSNLSESIVIDIPYWPEVKDICKRLHNGIDTVPLVGWDLAITKNGPIVIEGNIQPSLDVHQREPYGPFIGTEFYDLFVQHLNNSTKVK